jgi:hypothetical protein
MTTRVVAAKMIPDRRGNRMALISLGVLKLIRFAQNPYG